jgi:hypothetical protein
VLGVANAEKQVWNFVPIKLVGHHC